MPDIVIEARKAAIAPGMEVRRILPFRLRRMVGPFIFMDHAGPVNIQPAKISAMDVLPHPHIGLSTVSYLFGGQVTHRDSLGVEQIIRPGEVNWMTAGKDRKSTRLNSSHGYISYAVFCLKKKKKKTETRINQIRR